jgi:hypothetical protein
MTKEDISRLINSVVFALKFDVGLLVLAGTIFTLLKLDRIEVLEGISQVKFVIIFIVFLILFGLIIEKYLALIDLNNLNDEEIQKKKKIAFRFLKAQLILNIVLIAFMSGFAIGWIDSYLILNNQEKFADELRTSIKRYVEEKNRLPVDLNEIWAINPLLLNKFKKTEVGYKILNNPYKWEDLFQAGNKKIAELVYNELVTRGTVVDSLRYDFDYLRSKAPEIWDEISRDSISVGLSYEYIIILPGIDLELNTDDDRVFRFSTILVYPFKLDPLPKNK